MTKITALTPAGSVTTSDLVEVVQAGVNKKALVQDLANAVGIPSKDPVFRGNAGTTLLADEFSDNAFHPDWVKVEDAVRLRWREGGDVLSAVMENVVVGAAGKPHALIRPFTVPAADAPWTIEAATRRMTTYATDYMMGGLLLTGGVDYAASPIMWNMPYQHANTAGANLSVRWGADWNAGTNAGSPNYSGDWSTYLHQRMCYLGGGQWTFYYSPDGVGWLNVHGGPFTYTGFVPTHVGFGVGSWGNTGQRGVFTAEYLRIYDGNLGNAPAVPYASI